MEGVNKIALFIDADNVSSRFGKLLMNNLEKRGEVTVRRIYGNWEKPALRKWDDCILRYGLRTVHQIDFSTGKNATDMTLTIDAMDVLYKQQATTFAIVSNDSDFTPLAVRLREYGIYVIGIGRKDSSVSFKNACSEFISLDSLNAEADEEEKFRSATENESAQVETQTAPLQEDKESESALRIAELERKIAELERKISEPQWSIGFRLTAEENKNSAMQKSSTKIKQKIICKNLMTDIAESSSEVEVTPPVANKEVPKEVKKSVEVAPSVADKEVLKEVKKSVEVATPVANKEVPKEVKKSVEVAPPIANKEVHKEVKKSVEVSPSVADKEVSKEVKKSVEVETPIINEEISIEVKKPVEISPPVAKNEKTTQNLNPLKVFEVVPIEPEKVEPSPLVETSPKPVEVKIEQPAKVAKKKGAVELKEDTSPPLEAPVVVDDSQSATDRAKALNLRLSQCGQKGMRNPKKKMQQIHDSLQESARLHGDKNGFVPLNFAGQDLKKKNLGFGVKDFGYTLLNEFISDFPELYELAHTKPRSFRYRCIQE